jgi:hypothetical protein
VLIVEFPAGLSWLLLGWLFAIVSQMTSASALLQPLSNADKEAAAAYFLADENGFHGRYKFYFL